MAMGCSAAGRIKGAGTIPGSRSQQVPLGRHTLAVE